MDLVDSLIKEGWLKTPRIIEAFREIKRIDFLPEDMKDFAELNEALPIGYGQTISQPLVVAFMIELLDPQPGDKILDIGSGSGWTTALLAEIVTSDRQQGKVVAIEIIPELKEFGEKNVAKYNFIEKGIVKFICADGSKGYQKEAPFDKILCSAAVQWQNTEGAMGEKVSPEAERLKPRGFKERSEASGSERQPKAGRAERREASAREILKAWKEQLKIGGRIVTPIGTSIWLFIKRSEREFEEMEYPGFVFVPLIEK